MAPILLAVLLYAGIVVSNNRIAEGLRQQVDGWPLPPDTERVESVAVAGKMDGNGNGMQYFGGALLHSRLDEAALRAWYEPRLSDGESLRVARQDSPLLFECDKRCFQDFEDDGRYWVVMLCRYNSVDAEETPWDALLNLDIRGH